MKRIEMTSIEPFVDSSSADGPKPSPKKLLAARSFATRSDGLLKTGVQPGMTSIDDFEEVSMRLTSSEVQMDDV